MSDDDEIKEGQLEITAPRFTHLSDEQIVRLHVYDGYGASADWDGDTQVKALANFYHWIMTGELPDPPVPEPPKPPKLRTVK